MRLRVLASVVILCLFDPPSAWAQTPAERPPQDVVPSRDLLVFQTEIVVTPERRPEVRSRIPAAAAVLTRREIEQQPAQTLPELLELLPGFHVLFDQGLGATPMVSSRGFFGGGEAEYIQLLINGVPAADVESGLADWSSVQAAEIERIDALRGPGSSLYGDTALGGVVQIFTRQSPGRGRASLAGGSSAQLVGSAGYQKPMGPVAVGLSGSGWRTGGYRDHSDARQGSLHASLGWPRGNPRLALDGSALTRRRQEPGPLTAAELADNRFGSNAMFRFDRENTDKGRAAIAYRRATASSQYQIRVHAAGRQTDLLRTLLIGAGVGDRSMRGVSTLAATVGGEAGTTVGGAGATELQITSGLEISHERLDTSYDSVSSAGDIGSRTAALDAYRRRVGGFGLIGLALGERVRISSGVRVDQITDRVRGAEEGPNHVAWSPRVGVNLLAGSIDGRPLSLFVQGAHAFKAPTMDQLFDPHPFPDFRGGTFQISSDTLEPQRAWNVEAGVSQALPAIRWEVVAYRLTVQNEIDFDPATFRYGNIGRSRHSGVELDVRLWGPRPVSAGFAYTWTLVTPLTDAAPRLQLKNIPRHLLRSDVTVTLPHAVRIHGQLTFTAGRHLDDEHEFPLRDAAVIDLRVAKKVARSVFTFDVLNVTNTRVEELGFALLAASGNRVPYYYPGIGFAVRAEFSIDF